MGVLGKFFGPSPFVKLQDHSKKVHECVELLRPLTNALLAEDYDKIDELQDLMSKTEHEADQIKTKLRDNIADLYFLSVGKDELSKLLAYQDDVADAAEDFSVVLTLRRTKLPDALKEDFMTFVEQVISVSEKLMDIAEKLSMLAEAAFTGKEAKGVLNAIDVISEEEWKADRLERKFARHFYSMEKELDPITILFLEKYCTTLSAVANNAERTAKYLRLVIRKK
jgi:uncharacterized protein